MSDLYIGIDEPTTVERSAVDEVVAVLGAAIEASGERMVRSGQARRNQRRHLLLPALHALQNQAGWISPGGANHIADQLQVPPAEVFGVASFYDLFQVEEPARVAEVVHVCVDAACQIAGSGALLTRRQTEAIDGGPSAKASPCLGQCDRPVAEFIQGHGGPDQVRVGAEFDDEFDEESWDLPQAGDLSLRLLARVGRVDPNSLESYVGAGGYRALAAAFSLGADGVVAEVEASGLMGRGGAAFPTGVKWRAVRNADPSGPDSPAKYPAGPDSPAKYVVVNADESEPGTFKDRVLLEKDPFAVIEAATIAGFAVGASKGWIYIRGEYPLATARLELALAQAREAGFLGTGIARSSFDFDIEVRRGAGAYICGEETALFNSLEGFRGEPRQKPPFPTTDGLFGQPTAINNPETLVNVLDIVTDGGAAYAARGTERSAGSKLFCLSAHVAVPGVYEVEFGATLGEVIELAGGVVGQPQTVLLGGAAGSFVGPEAFSMPLTFEASREAGVSLGSGVIMVFNTETDMAPVVARVAEFFRHESCGQCVPCRVGTMRQHEIVVNLTSGSEARSTQPDEGAKQLDLLDEMDRAMKDASICGLGHTAATAVRSAIDLGLLDLANRNGAHDG